MDHNRQQDITTIMAEVANAVVGEFNIESLLDHIINTTMEVLHAEVCSIFLEDKESQPGVLKCVAGSGFAKNIVDIGEYKIGEGFTGSVAKHGGEYNIKSPKELQNLKIKGGKVWLGKYDPNQWEKGKNKFRNLIALRLEIKGQTLGVIKAENKIEDFGPHFSDEDAKTFNTIATVIS